MLWFHLCCHCSHCAFFRLVMVWNTITNLLITSTYVAHHVYHLTLCLGCMMKAWVRKSDRGTCGSNWPESTKGISTLVFLFSSKEIMSAFFPLPVRVNKKLKRKLRKQKKEKNNMNECLIILQKYKFFPFVADSSDKQELSQTNVVYQTHSTIFFFNVTHQWSSPGCLSLRQALRYENNLFLSLPQVCPVVLLTGKTTRIINTIYSLMWRIFYWWNFFGWYFCMPLFNDFYWL